MTSNPKQVTPERVLVVGATGTVGSEVVKALQSRPVVTRVLVRSKQRAARLPESVEVAVGDLTRPEDIARALAGVDAAFYLSPHIEQEVACSRRFTEECARAGTRLVFLGSHIDGPNRVARWLLRGLVGLMMSDYRPKFQLSEEARTSDARPVVLVPSHFFQNDEMQVVRRALLDEHRFVHPIGRRGLNRVDASDIGEAAAVALTDPTITPGAYPIVGTRSWTGPECAAVWSDVMGVPVEYCETEPSFESQLADEFRGKKLSDVRSTYRQLHKFAVPTKPEQVQRTAALLGRQPISYDVYVRRTWARWRNAAQS